MSVRNIKNEVIPFFCAVYAYNAHCLCLPCLKAYPPFGGTVTIAAVYTLTAPRFRVCNLLEFYTPT